jgi:hypothetical protein
MGSFERFNIQVQHTIIFTMGIMNLKALQRIFTFFQVYGIDCKPNKQNFHM